MKKIFTLGFTALYLAAVFMPASVFAVSSKDLKQKLNVKGWCTKRSFKKQNRYQAYGDKFVIIGVEKIRIGKLKKMWTCHYILKNGLNDRTSIEHWDGNKKGDEPFRVLEHRYDVEHEKVLEDGIQDTWISQDPKTRVSTRCYFSSLNNATVCAKLNSPQ